ncbi:MAG: hypothetical protein P4L83_05435 [Nevskia sp.]|nr:hypothetical protein [Nevskia sp.]
MAKGTKTGGRQKGTPNRVTADIRGTMALLAERNAEHVQRWLDAVAANDPGRALDLYLRMIEYAVPKLARTELAGSVGVPGLRDALEEARKRVLRAERRGV